MEIKGYDFVMEKSKDDFNIINIHKDNRKIYIGSKYRMKDKIDEFISNITLNAGQDTIFLVFGIGSGECIAKLSQLYNKNKIIIFEPNVELINYIEQNPTKYKFLQKEQVYLINSKKDILQESLDSIIGEFEVNKIICKGLLNYGSVYDKEFLYFNKVVRQVITDKTISVNTGLLFSDTWFETLLRNLKYTINSTIVEKFKDKYKNKPAIIVSAGPSLSKNIDELKNINKDVLILSGGRTLRPLLDRGLEPNLIGVVDAGENSYKQMEGYVNKCSAPMLFYEGTNIDVLKYHKGKKIFFTQSDMLSKIFNTDITNLAIGGSIAHTLTMAAVLFGCNPIIFIGQDLAYTGEKFHADIAINQFSNIKDNQVKDTNEGLYVEDINGGKVRTSEVLDNFRRDFENIIKMNKDVLFIDATEGGAKIKGTVLMNLEDAIEKYKSKEKITDLQDNIVSLNKNIIKKNIINKLNQAIKASDFIKRKCKESLKILDDLKLALIKKDNVKINSNLKRLDKIDESIKEKYKNLEILNNLLYSITYTILTSYKAENDEEVINKNKFLYKSILDKIEYALKRIEETLLEIENIEM